MTEAHTIDEETPMNTDSTGTAQLGAYTSLTGIATPDDARRLVGACADLGVERLMPLADKQVMEARLDEDSEEKGSFDAFGAVCRAAREAGMEIHAWLNAFRIRGSKRSRAVAALGKVAVTRDGAGKSLLDYNRSSMPDGGYWLDPGDPEVRDYLCGVIREILTLYPDIDGIHLDYTRYPFDEKSGRDFGYGTRSVESFRTLKGYDPAGCAGARRRAWNDWRRAQETAFVREARAITAARGKKLSVADKSDREKASAVAFQEWPLWARKGLVDFVVPMNYSADASLVKRRTRAAVAAAGDARRVAVGIGAYKMLDDAGALARQIKDCLHEGVAGVVLFSYDNMAKRPGLFSYIGRTAFAAGG